MISHEPADRPTGKTSLPAMTERPYTYCIWYRPDPESEEFLGELASSPPDLYHLGYQVPFKGGYGPAYGGELYSDEMLGPDEVGREVERLEGVIGRMRRAGVDRIIPYVFTMAFFGRPVERKGFFNFYDHWDEYRGYGLGPKPEADPSLWSQARGPHQLGDGPPGVLHYDPCINHPGWLDYLDLVIRQIAAVGYDGVFLDVNTLYCFCPQCQARFDVYLFDKYGPDGLREVFGTDDHRLLNLSTIYPDFKDAVLGGFRVFLEDAWEQHGLSGVLGVAGPHEVSLERDSALLRAYMQGSDGEFPPAHDLDGHLAKRFGGVRAEDVQPDRRPEFVQTVLRHHFLTFLQSDRLASRLEERFGSSDLRVRCCPTPRDLLLWVETQRFWCDSMSVLFERLRRVAQEQLERDGRSGDFYTVTNVGPVATLDGVNNRRVDGTDFVGRAPVCDMQMCEEMLQPGSLESGAIVSNFFAFRWAMAAGTRICTLLYHAYDNGAADLAQAEVAAGGGGAFVQCGLVGPESRGRWRRFFAEHGDLWDGGTSWTRVGVLFWSDQLFYEHPEHYAIVRRLTHVLAETQVPFDIVTERAADTIAEYDVVFAPMLRYLSASQVGSLLEYARAGRDLVVIEPFGTEDRLARSREGGLLPEKSGSSGAFECVPYGKGRLIILESEDVPARRSDVWCLMEDRVNNFGQARECLNEARRRDIENGVDLGSGFVGRLEESLGRPLRWCPASTDPGVYIHAYRMPANGKSRERLVVHAVNYRVPILPARREKHGKGADWLPVSESGEPVAACGVGIRVPLPAGMTVAHVETLTPLAGEGAVEWKVEDGDLVLTLDRLRIYTAIVAGLELAL